MVGELFLAIAGAYLSVAIGVIIWYQIRGRREEAQKKANEALAATPPNP